MRILLLQNEAGGLQGQIADSREAGGRRQFSIPIAIGCKGGTKVFTEGIQRDILNTRGTKFFTKYTTKTAFGGRTQGLVS